MPVSSSGVRLRDIVAILKMGELFKGHAGHKENERRDLLVRGEITKIRKAFTPERLAEAMTKFRNKAAESPLSG